MGKIVNNNIQLRNEIENLKNYIKNLEKSINKWSSSICYKGDDIPSEAVLAGYDSDGDEIYAGRVHHKTEILPAKIFFKNHKASVFWDGQQHIKYEYEILCGDNYKWVKVYNDKIPSKAIAFGETIRGEILYMGRAYLNNKLKLGILYPTQNCAYAFYDGEENQILSYEVLVDSPNDDNLDELNSISTIIIY